MTGKTVFVGNPQPESYGVSIITNKLVQILKEKGFDAKEVYSLENLPKDAFIIPYGIDLAVDMINKGFNTDVVFLADAFTLGYRNKIEFYLKQCNIFHYDFFYSIYCLLRDYRIESNVLRNFKRIALVSEVDIKYFKKRSRPNTEFFCVPNGANFAEVEPKVFDDHIRLGILSSWWHTTLAEENDWFIRDYFSKYIRKHPNVILYLAGKGSYINQYRGLPNVRIMGEVPTLNDFFKHIDIFVVPNPKGCGILNRVLDAFAYKTCVIGHKNAFSGFTYMKDCYLDFDNYSSFETKLNDLVDSKEVRKKLAQNAFTSIIENNQWDKNLSNFISSVIR